MAAMRAMKSTATSVKVLAQKTQQMPELIDKAIKRPSPERDEGDVSFIFLGAWKCFIFLGVFCLGVKIAG